MAPARACPPAARLPAGLDHYARCPDPCQPSADGRLSGLNTSLVESSRLFCVPVAFLPTPAQSLSVACRLNPISQPGAPLNVHFATVWPTLGRVLLRTGSHQHNQSHRISWPRRAQAGKGRSSTHLCSSPWGAGLLPSRDSLTLGTLALSLGNGSYVCTGAICKSMAGFWACAHSPSFLSRAVGTKWGPAVWARWGAALCSLWTPAGEVESLPVPSDLWGL